MKGHVSELYGIPVFVTEDSLKDKTIDEATVEELFFAIRQKLKEKSLPKYVIGGLRLRKNPDSGKLEYYRDGGDWSLDFKVEDDKILGVSPMQHFANKVLKPILEEEWRKSNGEYAPY